MATIVTRVGKGSPLSFSEIDSNFTNLNSDILLSKIANFEIITANGTFTVPSETEKIEVIVVGGAGGTSAGGTTSFGALSASGGGAQITATGSNTAFAPLNLGGIGTGGTVNLRGQSGSVHQFYNPSASPVTNDISGAGGMTPYGLGRGSNNTASASIAAGQQYSVRGGAGGGVAVSVLTVTEGQTFTVVVGPGGGNGASDGMVIVRY